MCFTIFKPKNQGCSIKDSLDSCNIPIIEFTTTGTKEKQGFIIDTGASTNFIDQKYVLQNNLKENNSHDKIISANSSFTTFSTVDISFTINQKSYNDSFIVTDLSQTTDFIHSQYHYNTTVCGILGGSFLKENNAIINYKTKTIDL